MKVLNKTNFLYKNICFQELINTLKDNNGNIKPIITIDDINKI